MLHVRNLFAVAGCAALVAVAPAAYSGGWMIYTDLPRPTDDARLGGSVLTFQAAGCLAPGTSLTATAEGIVNGERVSQVLHPISVEREGTSVPVYGLRREWPSEGRWVIAITAKNSLPVYRNGKATAQRSPLETTALVPILPDGTPQTRATPGGKYDQFLVTIRTNRIERTAVLTRLLATPNVPKVATSTLNP